MSIEDIFTMDAEALVVPTTEELQDIQFLADKQLHLERELKAVEEYGKKVSEALRQVQEIAIPNLMASIGMKEFKLANGCKVAIKEDVYASIRKEYISEAVEWLDAQALGDVVKDEIKVNFGRGESDLAKQLMEFCKEQGFIADEKLSVHPSTLKALVKEQMARGVEFPEEFFSIAPVKKAVIKLK